jgi:hypothetical protein
MLVKQEVELRPVREEGDRLAKILTRPSEDADAPDSEKHDVTRLHRSSRCRLPQAQVSSSLEDVAVHIKRRQISASGF